MKKVHKNFKDESKEEDPEETGDFEQNKVKDKFFKKRKEEHSLNKAVRTKEIHRIMHDNEAMLKRL